MTLFRSPEIPFSKSLIRALVPDHRDYKYMPHDPKALYRRGHYNLITMVHLE
jgi:hypothetical protein